MEEDEENDRGDDDGHNDLDGKSALRHELADKVKQRQLEKESVAGSSSELESGRDGKQQPDDEPDDHERGVVNNDRIADTAHVDRKGVGDEHVLDELLDRQYEQHYLRLRHLHRTGSPSF